MVEQRFKRVSITVEFADGKIEEFTADEPDKASMTVNFPVQYGSLDLHGAVDPTMISTEPRTTFELNVTLGEKGGRVERRDAEKVAAEWKESDDGH